MIGDHEWYAVVPMDLPSQLPDRELCVEKSLRCKGPKSNDHFWPDQFELSDEIRTARNHFFRKRITISGWTVLEDVADEHLVTC